MTYLRFYDVERQQFSTAENVKLDFNFAKMVVKKLVRHFKIEFAGVNRNPTRWVGHAWNNNTISLPKQASVLLICHELAHLYNRQNFGDWTHCKKLMRTIKKIVHYCMKMLPLWLGDSRVLSLLEAKPISIVDEQTEVKK